MKSKHCILPLEESLKFKLSIFDAVQLVNQKHWNAVVGDNNVYLCLAYLTALESTLSKTIDFRYILFYDNQYAPVGVAIVQLHRFNSDEIDYNGLSNRLTDIVPKKVLDKMDARVMLCGNAFSTGENGFLFCDTISKQVMVNNIINALHRIKKDEKKSNDQVSLVILKDFWPASFESIKHFESDRYREVVIDVNMVLRISSEWKSWEDYLHAMTTKFRTKIKGIYKKSKNVVKTSLSADEILQVAPVVNELYKEVLNRAKFKFGILNAQSFVELKKALNDDFEFNAYWLNDELIGFSTAIKDGRHMEANFVGIRYHLNNENALYQRMLCDFVQEAIAYECTELRMGRTAEEIKSSLGAAPVPMKILLKHRNAITNRLIKPFVESIEASTFDIRRPFKAAVYDQWIQ